MNGNEMREKVAPKGVFEESTANFIALVHRAGKKVKISRMSVAKPVKIAKLTENSPIIIMKSFYLLLFIAFASFAAGCAGGSSSGSSSEGSSMGNESSAKTGSGEKTAYDGATGSGLLMERYKSGRIEGLND